MSTQKHLHTDEILRIVAEMEKSVQQKPVESVTGKPKSKRSFFSWVKRILFSTTLISLTVSSTIFLLPRMSIYYTSLQFNPVISIGLSAIVLFLFWMIILTIISILISCKVFINKYVRNTVLLSLLAYTGFATFFVNQANFKSSDIEKTYMHLHPVVRIGLTTTILVDSDLMITDGKRTKDEYIKWGLTPLQRSDHYIQRSTGYVHAVDFRTIGRPEWKNNLLDLGFKLMGYKTLRHIGTADHLHVYLPRTDKK